MADEVEVKFARVRQDRFVSAPEAEDIVSHQEGVSVMASDQSDTLRRRAYLQLEPSARFHLGLSTANKFLAACIIIATALAILATEPVLSRPYGQFFRLAELALGVVFVIEYLLRFWVAAETNKSAASGRMRFVLSFSGMVDLVVAVATVLPFISANLAVLRIVRLIRIARLAKLGRMSVAMYSLGEAIHSRRFELILTMVLAISLLLLGASGLYWLEGDLQPDKFGSVPRALWWAVITMTTIGYGDVYPITVPGKVVASLVAFGGIGLIAMPTGILAAAFSDAMQKRNVDH